MSTSPSGSTGSNETDGLRQGRLSRTAGGTRRPERERSVCSLVQRRPQLRALALLEVQERLDVDALALREQVDLAVPAPRRGRKGSTPCAWSFPS